MKSLSISFIFNILILFILNNYIDATVTNLNFPTNTSISFENEESSTFITINMENYTSITDEFFHIFTKSDNNKVSPLIIYSSFQSEPSINSSDIYSTQRVGDAHLYLGKDSLNYKIYLNITCNIFPCSYNLYLDLIEKPIIYPGQTYSYFVKDSKNNFTNFR